MNHFLSCMPAAPALLLALGAAAASANELTVEVHGGDPGGGRVIAAVYDGSGPWLRDALQAQRGQPGAPAELVFRDLPAGAYALAAFQDRNGNGRLDRNLVGLPLEPYGFSRDAAGRMGPPEFEAAAVEVRGATRITIHLR